MICIYLSVCIYNVIFTKGAASCHMFHDITLYAMLCHMILVTCSIVQERKNKEKEV